MNSTLNRNANIEILRILTSMGVFVLHYCNPFMGGALNYTSEINSFVLIMLVAVFDCAVNLFILISGYFMCMEKRVSIWKTIMLVIQVVAFNLGFYFLRVIFWGDKLTVESTIQSLIPNNYYVILYCAIFLISPYINVAIKGLPIHYFRKMVKLLLLLFSVYPTFVDILGEILGYDIIGLSSVGAWGSQWGYTIINFTLMYLIGAWIRIDQSSKKQKSLIIEFVINIFIITIWGYTEFQRGMYVEARAFEYCNPIIIWNASIIFRLFNNIKIKNKYSINLLSKASFTMYLLHEYFLKYIKIENYASQNIVVVLFHIIVCDILIYCISWIVWAVYDNIIGRLLRKIELKKPWEIYIN